MGCALEVNHHETISVVIPTHDSEATIERCLQSVADQTHQPDEVIIVDNGSQDHTLVKVHNFVTLNKELNIIIATLTQNTGPGNARNIGWDLARSSMVAFLDSDDSWHPKKLEIQLSIVRSHPTYSFFGHSIVVVNDGHSTATLDPLSSTQVKFYGLWHFLVKNRVSTPTVMLRRSLKPRFPVHQWHAEDFALWTRLVSNGYKLVFAQVPLTHLHKATFGSSGLSAALKQMHLGELRVVESLRKEGSLSGSSRNLVKLWMQFKYGIRRIRVRLRG